MKCCTQCHEEKPLADFPPHNRNKSGRQSSCRKCSNLYAARIKLETPARIMLYSAKQRAARAGVPFELTPEDIHIPAKCPVLGIPLSFGQGEKHDGSPSIDRVSGDLGYVPDNIRIISWRANRLKSDATLEELEAVLAYYRAALAA